MKFIEVHHDKSPILINMDMVVYIQEYDNGKAAIYLEPNKGHGLITTDESYSDILELINK